jgi:PadR family transcriptional regulator, regulatory protein PadR
MISPRGIQHCFVTTRTWFLHYYAMRATVLSALLATCLDTVMEISQLLKGVLDLAVLAVLSVEDGYGYDVVRRLRQAGLDEVGDASVYGTLRRLYNAGALTTYVRPSEEGPHRKYYGLNDVGRQRLADGAKTWRGFATTMADLLEGTA